MEKITLTKNDIKKEALQQIFSFASFVLIILTFLLFVCFFGLRNVLENENANWLYKGFVIIIGILAPACFFGFLYTIYEYILVCMGKYSIKTAALVNKRESEGSIIRRRRLSKPYKPAKFFFSDNMHFIIDEYRTYYKWTYNMRMTRKDLFESSVIGDKFYLITIGKKKKTILLFFNQNFFEYID